MDSAELIKPGDVVNNRYRVSQVFSQREGTALVMCEHLYIQRELFMIVCAPEVVGTDAQTRRFLSKCRTASSLNHPNLSRIYDYGVVMPSRALFVVFEYVEGTLLSRRLKQDVPLHPTKAYGLIKDVTRGLEQLHHRGIVHGGLALNGILIKQEDPHAVLLSVHIPVQRRPAFMDSALGAAGESASQDVYLMGALIMALLSPDGYASFYTWTDPLEQIPQELLHSALGPVLKRALARKPHERYDNASALLYALNMVEVDYLYQRLGHTPPQGVPALDQSQNLARISLTNMLLIADSSSVLDRVVSDVAGGAVAGNHANPWRQLVYKEMRERAQQAMSDGEFAQALRLFERCQKEHPEDMDLVESIRQVRQVIQGDA